MRGAITFHRNAVVDHVKAVRESVDAFELDAGRHAAALTADELLACVQARNGSIGWSITRNDIGHFAYMKLT